MSGEGQNLQISDDNSSQTVFNEWYSDWDCMMWDEDCYFAGINCDVPCPYDGQYTFYYWKCNYKY